MDGYAVTIWQSGDNYRWRVFDPLARAAAVRQGESDTPASALADALAVIRELTPCG